MRERWGHRLFYGIVLFSMGFSAVYLALRRGAGIEGFLFEGGGNLFGDFINNLHYPTHEGGPWFDSIWATFPPLAYTVYWLLNVCLTRANYIYELLAYTVITSFTCVLMLCAIQRIFQNRMGRAFSPSEPLGLCLCALLSGVTVYTIERGNSVLNVMVMLLWALALRDSKEAWKREAALALIAVAANFKLYPAVFGVLYLFEKRWREAVRLVLYGVALFVVPFAWFSGWDGFRQFLYNQQAIHSSLYDGYLTSLPSAAGWLAAEFGWNGEAALRAGEMLALLLAAALAVCVVLDRRLWMRSLLLCSLFTLVPGWSAEYMAVYMLLPLVLCWCDGANDRWFPLYMALFAGVFVLLPFGVGWETHARLSWNMLVSFACLYGLTFTAIADVLSARLRKGGSPWEDRKRAAR